jgi:predicted ATP-dependent serine protease
MWSINDVKIPTRLTALDMQLGGETRLTGAGCFSDFGLRRPSFVVLVGDPGSGKSNVLWEVVRNVSADGASVLCVSETLRVDDEVSALVTVRASSSPKASTSRIAKQMKKNTRSVLVLDELLAVQVHGPLARIPGRSTLVDRKLKTLCAWAHTIAVSHNMCVIASMRYGKDRMVNKHVKHGADAVIEVTRDHFGAVTFRALKNRYGHVDLRAA